MKYGVEYGICKNGTEINIGTYIKLNINYMASIIMINLDYWKQPFLNCW